MDSSEFDGLQFGTRETNKSRKRLGKGQKASACDDVPEPDLRKSKRKKAIDVEVQHTRTMAVLPGIESCFVGARRGSKGLQGALRKGKDRVSLAVTLPELDRFDKETVHRDPCAEDLIELTQSYLDRYGAMWIWHMQINSNIFFFGVGCKRALIRQFHDEYLEGEDVITINGISEHTSSSNRVILDLLESICTNILHGEELICPTDYLDLETYARTVCEVLNDHYTRDLIQRRTSLDPGYNSARNNIPEDREGVVEEEKSLLEKALAEMIDNDPAKDAERAGAVEREFRRLLKTKMYHTEPASDPLENDPFSFSAADVATSSVNFPLSAFLTNGTMPTAAEDDPYGEESRSRLYIFVSSIEGESLRSDESQMCLSILAACPSVSIIATADNLNTSLLWNPQMLAGCKWINSHVPTYLRYLPNDREDNGTAVACTDFAEGSKALEYIYRSLTQRHRELIRLLAQDALKQHNANWRKNYPDPAIDIDPSRNLCSYTGISIEDLLKETSKKVIARNLPELNTLLRELQDHKVVSKDIDASRRYRISILLPLEAARNAAVLKCS